MYRTLLICVTTFAAYAMAQATVDIQSDVDLACLVSDGDTKFNLTALEKQDGTVYSDSSYQWNFCRYLASTNYFASHLDLMVGMTPVTSASFTPSSVQVIKDENDKKIGVSYTREETGQHC